MHLIEFMGKVLLNLFDTYKQASSHQPKSQLRINLNLLQTNPTNTLITLIEYCIRWLCCRLIGLGLGFGGVQLGNPSKVWRRSRAERNMKPSSQGSITWALLWVKVFLSGQTILPSVHVKEFFSLKRLPENLFLSSCPSYFIAKQWPSPIQPISFLF